MQKNFKSPVLLCLYNKILIVLGVTLFNNLVLLINVFLKKCEKLKVLLAAKGYRFSAAKRLHSFGKDCQESAHVFVATFARPFNTRARHVNTPKFIMHL